MQWFFTWVSLLALEVPPDISFHKPLAAAAKYSLNEWVRDHYPPTLACCDGLSLSNFRPNRPQKKRTSGSGQNWTLKSNTVWRFSIFGQHANNQVWYGEISLRETAKLIKMYRVFVNFVVENLTSVNTFI